jgi:hypothetical protein
MSGCGTTPAAFPFRLILLLFQTAQRRENSGHTVFYSLRRCQSAFQSILSTTPNRVQRMTGSQSDLLSIGLKMSRHFKQIQ